MWTFEFVLLLVLWEKVFAALQKASKELQSIKTDLIVLKALLEMALSDLVTFRSLWNYILESAKSFAKEWNIPCNFKESRKRKTKKHFDEISSDERLEDPEKRFRVNILYDVLGVAINQLKSRFEGQSFVTDVFSFIFFEI